MQCSLVNGGIDLVLASLSVSIVLQSAQGFILHHLTHSLNKCLVSGSSGRIDLVSSLVNISMDSF